MINRVLLPSLYQADTRTRDHVNDSLHACRNCRQRGAIGAGAGPTRSDFESGKEN